MGFIDHEYTDDLVCPYCGHKHEDDGEMNEGGEFQCSKCKMRFNFDVDYSKTYTSAQVPCLNGEPHKYATYTNPPTQTKTEWCGICGKKGPG